MEKDRVFTNFNVLAGWVCYAEKTHGSYVLPYISTTKSPQQIMGSFVKDHIAKLQNKYTLLPTLFSLFWHLYYKFKHSFICRRKPDEVYHVCIMPCFDKKLEASREQFYSDVFHTRDVDCVISTLEVEQMLLKDGVDLVCLPSADLDSM